MEQPKDQCLATSMCCPEGSFLDTLHVNALAPLPIYLFLPVFEKKVQLHLLSKKGSGLTLLVPVEVSGIKAVAVVLTKMGTQAQPATADPGWL